MYKQYKLVFILTILITIIFCVFLLVFYPLYIQNLDNRDYKNSLAGELGGAYPLIEHGLPGEQNVIFNQIDELSFEKNVILIGGSTTRWGVLRNCCLPNNWTLYNFGMGFDKVYSDKVMINYINNYANHKLNKNDVVIFHINFWHFSEEPPKSDYTRKVIENYGIYQIDDSGKITGQMTDLKKMLLLNKVRINYFYLTFPIYMAQSIRQPFTPSPDGLKKSSNNLNLNNSGPDEETLKKYKKLWIERIQNTTYPNNSSAEFEELIRQLNSQTNVVVVNLYTPSWVHNYSKEQEYEQWLENNLTPFLKTEKIPYLDFSSTIPDSDYRDSNHLLMRGRERYTTLFNNEIDKILSNITTNQLVEK